tara:strand:- start:181 stop:1344 length:1164 start_codon:yes stop_codon:yes gene_type:complete
MGLISKTLQQLVLAAWMALVPATVAAAEMERLPDTYFSLSRPESISEPFQCRLGDLTQRLFVPFLEEGLPVEFPPATISGTNIVLQDEASAEIVETETSFFDSEYLRAERFAVSLRSNGFLFRSAEDVVHEMIGEIADNNLVNIDRETLVEQIELDPTKVITAGLSVAYSLDIDGGYTQSVALVITGNPMNKDTSENGTVDDFHLKPNSTLSGLLKEARKADIAVPPEKFPVTYDAEGEVTYVLQIEAEYKGALHLDNSRDWAFIFGLGLGFISVGTNWELTAKPKDAGVTQRFDSIGFPATLAIDFDMTARGLTTNPSLGLQYAGIPGGFYIELKAGFAAHYLLMDIDGGIGLSSMERQAMDEGFSAWNLTPIVGLMAGWNGMHMD